ncbi:MAG: deoxyribose-phosphate aldolase [Bacteroidota bacterium]
MDIASFIDHTILRPDCTLKEVKQVCEEAKTYAFKAVCIPPYFVSAAANLLKDEPIKVSTVIGFPMGYATTAAKVEEIKRALNEGVDEVDVVVNLAALKNQDWSYVRNDADSVTRAVHLKGKAIKLIFETSLLTESEIDKLCGISRELEVDFVKTSTGFNGGGATEEIVKHLRANLPKKIKIKASGGIRDAATAIKMIEAGAVRLGCSTSIDLVSGSMPA